MPIRRLIAVALMALFSAAPAFAADWVVTALRGAVEQQVDGEWQPLARGDVVGNAQMVRTLANGYLKLQRDKEIVSLGSGTQIRIEQEDETGYTTVIQDFGRVEVDAEHKLVKHFAVETPYLAAVVKGTHFFVTSDAEGASVVVDRGAVAVQSIKTERSTLITPGQTAKVSRQTDIEVSGLGPWRPIVEPGVTRAVITASLGSALAPGPSIELASAPSLQAPAARTRTGTVLVAASSGMFGLAATGQSSAPAAPAQPVSMGIVLLGAVFGALIGGAALLLRRAV